MDAQQASAAQRENALQAQLADLSDRLNLNMAEALLGVEPEPVARRHRAFIESRAFSKLANFDSKAASWKDWSFKFENMAAAVVPSSRESLEWAARSRSRFRCNQSSSLRCTGRGSGRRGVGHCAEHCTRRRLGSMAETREKVRSQNSGTETDVGESHHQTWNSESA